ncbi:MAG: GDYXXLXY domain-containing protein [Salinivirgaceae bacterium]|nr:GDYXXLXY domain-containing protein [Salinivirgaceae bacterium]
MSKIKKIILALNLLFVFGFFAFSVVKKERLYANGTEILLKLAPVDPRSLMQGDYMELNYEVTNQIRISDGNGKYVVVKVGSDGVAKYERQQDDKELNEGELLICYKVNSKRRKCIGAENYFFQEGTGNKFADAEYGLLKVDDDGNCVLVGLCDRDKRIIK